MSISVQNIVKAYGSQRVVDGVSFEIPSRQIVGFIGPNGAGKSTTMKIIAGYLSQFEGTVLVNGIDVRENPIEVKKIIGYLPEHNPLYLDMYVREYLLFYAKIYGLGEKSKSAVDEVIEKIGLEKEQHKKIHMLSKGYRQRVGLASVLIHNPQVLILDEPTTGLDPNQLVEIRNLIETVGKSKTVLLSTHIMQEVEAICDKVIIINDGQMVANDSAEIIKKQNTSELTLTVEFLEECSREQLLTIPLVKEVAKVSERLWLLSPVDNADIRQNIFKFAVEHNLTVLSSQVREKSLETVFCELTQKTTE